MSELDWAVARHDSAVNTQYYRVTTCGRYSVAQVTLHGIAHYEGWLRARGGNPSTRLGMFAKPETAKRCCQRHVDKITPKFEQQLLEGDAAA